MSFTSYIDPIPIYTFDTEDLLSAFCFTCSERYTGSKACHIRSRAHQKILLDREKNAQYEEYKANMEASRQMNSEFITIKIKSILTHAAKINKHKKYTKEEWIKLYESLKDLSYGEQISNISILLLYVPKFSNIDMEVAQNARWDRQMTYHSTISALNLSSKEK